MTLSVTAPRPVMAPRFAVFGLVPACTAAPAEPQEPSCVVMWKAAGP